MRERLDNLLDAERLESCSETMVCDKFDPKTLIKEFEKTITRNLLPKKQSLVNNTPNQLLVITDRIKIQQLVLNLSTNASKYSETVTEIECTAEIDEDQRVCLIVEDEGPGLTYED